ncbi:MAG: ABC transporter ATP-binding protein [Thermoproteota archaeon]
MKVRILSDSRILQVEDLKVWFPIKRLFRTALYAKAVDGVSFTLAKGESLALVGESGCGKTTLGKTCLRLVKPTSGRLVYKGRDITQTSAKDLKWYHRETQIIYQDPFSSFNPVFTVYRILEEPLLVNSIKSREERVNLVHGALGEVKLVPIDDFINKYPHMLSGGQRQRLAIARALILKPSFVVADEPVSMLDASVRVEILYLLKDLQARHDISFIYITHDIATVKYFSNDMAVMYSGKIVEVGEIREVIKNPLHPYTEALIEAIPDPDPNNRRDERKVVPGEPQNPTAWPAGCRFHPRCPYAMEICKVKEPPMEEIKPEHQAACWLRTKH